MRLNILLLLVAKLAWLTTMPAVAQEPEASAKAESPAPARADAPPALTLESLQAELQQLRTQHEEESRQVRDEQVQREAAALAGYQQDAVDRERLLRLYGFADIGARHITTSDYPPHTAGYSSPFTFFLGRVNLYLDSQPDPDFRFLAETRFTLYPSGNLSGTTNTGEVIRTSTAVADTSSPNPAGTTRWGGVIIERVTLDWKRFELFSVRVGLFLTPFGIYNVDHGTPTLISVMPPAYLTWGWIPERQLGVQLFGSHFIDNWELSYAATVANARSDGALDIDDSKGFGGRLVAKRSGDLRLQLGVSGTYQPYRRDREQFGMDANGWLTYQRTRVVERVDVNLGADLSLDYQGLRIRSEFIFCRGDYASGKRDAALTAPGAYAPDYRGRDWFLIVAYRWWKLEPFVHSELLLYAPSDDQGRGAWVGILGLNVYLRSNVILKASYGTVRFLAGGIVGAPPTPGDMPAWDLILTWAF